MYFIEYIDNQNLNSIEKDVSTVTIDEPILPKKNEN